MDTLTAYHEAGHATISLLLGEMPDSASIEVQGDSLGHTAYLGAEATAIARSAVLGSTDADRDRVSAYLVGLAAGPAAHALKMRRGYRVNFIDADSWSTFGGGQDYAQLQRVLGTARRLISADADSILDEAYDMLEEPGIWTSVEHVAKDLLRFGELDFEGIRDAALNYDVFAI
jgi:hypothetical protein